jgi:hypothetical protein
MATIDYKQKIRNYMNSSEVDTLYKSMLNNLFPELKESKGDMIRKRLTEYFGGYYDGFATDRNPVNVYWEGLEVKEILAWLEKQGKKKSDNKADSIIYSYITPNPKFFQWIYDRLINVHNENPSVDYMLSLKKRIEDMQNPINYDMKEALQTEYEKGRADAIAEMQKTWSEEDERHLNTAVAYLKDAREFKKAAEDCINWLKFLKERYTWKPSDEQISIIEFVMEDIEKDSLRYAILNSILEQLKKLKA